LIIKNKFVFNRLHKLIEDETTGTPKEVANRLHISERLVYLMIDQLKDYDAPIAYDRSRKTYYYSEYFDLDVNISVCIRNKQEKTELFFG